MDDTSTIENDETLFRKLVLEGLTLAAIRQKMSPALEEVDDIPLIRKMMQVLQGGPQDG